MFACTVTQNGSDATVELRGEGHIEHAAEVRSVLLDALKNNRRLQINAAPDTHLGLPIMQLLCSAHRMAHQLGRDIALKDNSAAVLQDSMNRAGFCGSHGDQGAGGCIWTRRGQ